MSSILIKGANMPETCDYCPLSHYYPNTMRATEACKCLTRLIGAENRDGNPDIIKTTMLGMIRSDIMNAQFGMFHYIKLFMSKSKEIE